jgi:hypothetical protein
MTVSSMLVDIADRGALNQAMEGRQCVPGSLRFNFNLAVSFWKFF